MTSPRTKLLASVLSGVLCGPAYAGSPMLPYRVPTSDTNVDQICGYLPGSATPPRCDRTINKTTGVITIMAAALPQVTDTLTVTATDTLSALSHTPSTAVTLAVNGLLYSVGNTGTTATWNATTAGFHLAPGDTVTASYNQ